MKKQIIMGVIALATVGSFSITATAAGAAKVSVKEALADYSAKIKEAAFGAGRTAKGLSGQQIKIAEDKIIGELKLDGAKSNSLSMALSADSNLTAQRLDNLATIVAAKRMATEISKTDAAEGQSIDAAASASAKLIANSSLTGARKSVKELNTQELADTTAALQKLESLPESILTRFDGSERDSYTQILNRHDEIIDSGVKSSSEEAFIQAIMDVKKVDKQKAMEIVRKLKDCV